MGQALQGTNAQIPVLEFRSVSITFEGVVGLQDVSFSLGSGEMIIITGTAASGKSVLLHLAAGLLRPDSGEILINGRDIARLGEDELLHLRSDSLGIVFQEQSVFTALSVYDNTAYRLDELGWPEEAVEPAVGEILHFVGLEDDTEKLPEELSVGMRRRLEFARAIVGWRCIMLFDEATSGLDPINARMMMDLVIRARDIHGISSLYVTKELHEIPYLAAHRARKDAEGKVAIARNGVETSADLKVILLDRGKIAFFGSPAQFEANTSPAVLRMTHPAPGAPISTAEIADPWSKKRLAGHTLCCDAVRDVRQHAGPRRRTNCISNKS